MVIVGRLFVKVRALRIQFDPGSRDATGHYHSDTMLVVPALHASILMIGERFISRIAKHETLEVVSGEYFGEVKSYSMLLFLWAPSSYCYEAEIIGSIINSLIYKLRVKCIRVHFFM